jgi:hypothetical protein
MRTIFSPEEMQTLCDALIVAKCRFAEPLTDQESDQLAAIILQLAATAQQLSAEALASEAVKQ